MTLAHSLSGPKKPTNLSINSELLTKAKALDLNLSATFEVALASEIRKIERSRWIEENTKAIEISNAFSDANGLFADSWESAA
uniref:Antitoxin CcdA n=1 Tax=Candidatus Kentrum sp. FW TaxID=2126338 RepID=A0A450U2A0_9GAMM|nr:MAG: antitoxin CcdA [Candidatus Kentron sp. FW]